MLKKSLILFILFFAITPAANAQSWVVEFSDPTTGGNWQSKYIKDGVNSVVSYNNEGLLVNTKSGTDFNHNTVLWTQPVFTGDLKVEFEIKRLDNDTDPGGVNMVTFHGHGIGGEYPTDLSTWDRPVTGSGFVRELNSNTISYATGNNQLRSRYNVGRNEVPPTYENVNLFERNVWYKVESTLVGNTLTFKATNMATNQQSQVYTWTVPVRYQTGRIGFRQMYNREFVYKNISVSVLNTQSETTPTIPQDPTPTLPQEISPTIPQDPTPTPNPSMPLTTEELDLNEDGIFNLLDIITLITYIFK